MQAFTSKYIFDGSALLENKVVLVDNGFIHGIVDYPLPNKQTSRSNIFNNSSVNPIITNLGEGVITSGFIDLQVNGCGGVLFNEQISLNTLEIMYQTWLKFGTTSFLPTLISCDFKDVLKALAVVKQWFLKFGNKRGVLGIHLEGPFISKIKRGIHPEQSIISPTMELLCQITAYRRFFPIKMTIAVEEFTQAQIQFLLDEQIIVAIGHSNANHAQVLASIELGVGTATHMFNAMSGLTARNPGVIGAILNSDIYTGVIADGLHVAAANINILTKLKPDQVYLVTDAVTPSGTNLDTFQICGQTLYVRNGECITQDGTLGGAYLTMNKALEYCIKECNLSLANSLAMASTIPAVVMKVDDIIGRIKSGYRADLIYLDLNNFSCWKIAMD
ncbi:MAG: N-acetylglucosamine-6-phosphate deacetylase [Burkholderiales bacterium]|nr:N-acetylglucosamine-6-phosphate deacetylase [Burkholderiales bacterium]